MSARIFAVSLATLALPVVVALAQDAPGAGGSPAKAPDVIPKGMECAACHSSQVSRPFVHKALKQGCEACHDQDGNKHSFKLTMPIEKLCLDCHKEKIDADVKVGKLHEPVKKNECTKCHDPHGGNFANDLIKPEPQLCVSCHDKKVPLKASFVHACAKTDCGSCHKAHSAPKEKLLALDQPELCTKCHDKVAAIPVELKHKALKEGECTLACHTPHESAQKGLLLQPVTALCLDCHEETKKQLAQVKAPHKALASERSCLACHDAHGGKGPKLLNADTAAKVCGTCHKETAKHIASVNPKNVHEPVAKGECSACHEAHGGAVKNILKGTFPEKLYVPYDKSSYSLCFTCHKSELVTEKETTAATAFRNGEKNLHTVHVDKADKGRSCRACHDVHAADQPKLIRPSFKFGDWDAPILFRVTPTGGKCNAACHVAAEYDRESPKASLIIATPTGEGDNKSSK